MKASDHPSPGSAPRRRAGGTGGRLLLVAVLGLAVLAAGLLVFADDARLLRLGVVAALWAALVGAFAAARYRREIAKHTDRDDDLQRVYELELEREVSARREYELEVETTTRRQVEQEVRNEVRGELDGLRTELRTLTSNLEALLGGEVLVERVALRAESTRLRSLSDQSRAARSGELALPRGRSDDPAQPREWTPEAGRAYAADAEVLSSRIERTDTGHRPAAAITRGQTGDRTDVLPQYRPQPGRGDPPPARQQPPPQPSRQPARSEPARPEPPRREPLRAESSRTEPTRTHLPPSQPPLSQPPRTQPPRTQPQRPEPPRSEPPRREPSRTEPSRFEPSRFEPSRLEPPRLEPRRPPARTEPPGREPSREPLRAEPTRREPSPADTGRHEPVRHLPVRHEQPRREPAAYEEHRPPARLQPPAAHHEYRTGPQRIPPRQDPPRPQARDHGAAGPPSDPLGVDPLLAEQWAAAQHQEHSQQPSAWESFDSWVSANQSPPAATGTDGRRRRPDDTGSFPPPNLAAVVRRTTDAEPTPGSTGGRRRAPETTGSHSADDPIASYREDPEPRHRHRREA